MICRLSIFLLLSFVLTITAHAQTISDPITLPVTLKPTTTVTPEKAAPVYSKPQDSGVEQNVQALRDLSKPTNEITSPTLSPEALAALKKPAAVPPIGGAFDLINQNGNRVTDANFRNSYILVMFGYTYCRDDCPPIMANAIQAINSLPQAQANRILPVFVTLDPARDSPAALSAYLGGYGKRVVGLTGSQDEINRMAKNFGVNYRIVENPEAAIERSLSPQDLATLRRDPDYRPQSGEPYTIDYNPFIYLIGPDGKLLTLFNGGLPPENIANSLASALK